MTCCKNSIAAEEQHTGLAEQKAVQFREKIKSQEETNRKKGKQVVWDEDSWTCPLLVPLCELKMALCLNLIFHRLLTSRWKLSLRAMKGKWCVHQLEKQHAENLTPPDPGEAIPPLGSQGTQTESLLAWQKADVMVNFVCVNLAGLKDRWRAAKNIVCSRHVCEGFLEESGIWISKEGLPLIREDGVTFKLMRAQETKKRGEIILSTWVREAILCSRMA